MNAITLRPAGRFGWRRRRSALALFVVMLVIALMLMTTPAYGSSDDSGASAPRTTSAVVLSEAEADSLATLIDNLDFQVEMLRIDLKEARALARQDSIYADLMQERLERERGRQWWDRLWRNPALWFILGAYVGLEAAR